MARIQPIFRGPHDCVQLTQVFDSRCSSEILVVTYAKLSQGSSHGAVPLLQDSRTISHKEKLK